MRKFTTIALMGLFTATVAAAPLTPEQALRRATGEGPTKVRGNVKAMPLLETRSEENVNTIYLFGGDNGFIVASADDAAPAVLGYGDGPVATESGKLPDNFSYWLDFLSRRVREVSLSGGSAVTYNRPEWAVIEPLCQTQWNQGFPYNNECPTLNGKTCFTGCVATATAQVMKYHNWPPQGTDSLTYTWEKGGQDITTDFSTYTFDWENMCNKYDNTQTAEQNAAVAHLMRAVGGSVEMDYGTDASGAVTSLVSSALPTYFDYDKSIRYLSRDIFTLSQWEKLIYEALSCGPVLYKGRSAAGGHAFVCDGYAGDGYFHINWGWGGMSDANFLLDILDPDNQGIGGSDMDFNQQQGAIVNIKPNEGGEPFKPMLWAANGLQFSLADESPDYRLDIKGFISNEGPFIIPDGTYMSMTFQQLYDESYRRATLGVAGLKVGWGYSGVNLYVQDFLPDGTFIVSCEMTQDKQEWYPIMIKHDTEKFALLDVKTVDGVKTVTLYTAKIQLPECQAEYPSDITISNVDVSMTANLTSTSEFDADHNVRLEIINGSELYAYGEEKSVHLSGGDSAELAYTTTTLTAAQAPAEPGVETLDETGSDLQPGTYKMRLSISNNDGHYVPLTPAVEVSLLNGTVGVDAPEMENGASEVWYDMQGRMVSAENGAILAPGVYVKRTGNKSQKIVIR